MAAQTRGGRRAVVRGGLAAAALLPLLAGCEAVFGPAAQLDGSWTYAASSLTGGGWRCRVTGLVLELEQSGSDFSGTARGGELECVRGEEEIARGLAAQPVVNGRVSGRAIEFDIGTAGWHHVGRIEEASMTGTTTLDATLEVGADLAGQFGAARSGG